MIAYDINELAKIYDTLEFLNQAYNITIHNIIGSKSTEEVKSIINSKINEIIQIETDKNKIKQLKKFILKRG